MAVGHTQVVQALGASLPPVSLLLGPRSVGKWTVGSEALADHGVTPKRLRTFETFTVDDAREVVHLAGRSAYGGTKAVLARIDTATDASMNRMLKLLEDPPTKTFFVFVASAAPMLTVSSRAQTFRFGYLTEEEVVTVLVGQYGVPVDRAQVAARRSGGQVDRALDALRVGEAKGTILSVLKATAEGNEDLFYNAVGGRRADRSEMFGERQLDLLRAWAVEAKTGRWRMFSSAESCGLNLDATIVERVLRVTSRVDRPKVAVRAALLPVLWERNSRAALVG